MQMIIEFYTVNIFVKEAFITSVGPRRAGPGGPSQLTGRARPGWVKQRLGRAGLGNTWAATGRAEPEKMAQFRGLLDYNFEFHFLQQWMLHIIPL
jgi:hypothetical protein